MAKRESNISSYDLKNILALDAELFRLLTRRARLLLKQTNGEHLSAEDEKTLRLAWLEGAARVTKDTRVARDMFHIVQGMIPLTQSDADTDAGPRFFNLAPPKKPLDVHIPGPRSCHIARLYMAFAAASGQVIDIFPVPLSDAILEAVKVLNQLGGQLWWEESGHITNRGGKGLTGNMDKVLHAGDDYFNLCMVLAFSLGAPNRLKITGESGLRTCNLTPLKHFLPKMGARLTHVIPSGDGLPVRLECSGMLPNQVEIPEDLPVPFITALCLAAPFWEKPVEFFFPENTLNPRVAHTFDFLERQQVAITRRTDEKGLWLHVQPGKPVLPESMPLPIDTEIAAYLLLLPSLAGGELELEGIWPDLMAPEEDTPEAQKLWFQEDIVFEKTEKGVVCRMEKGARQKPDTLVTTGKGNSLYNANLYPLAVVVTIKAALEGEKVRLPAPPEGGIDPMILYSFLPYAGLEEDPESLYLVPVKDRKVMLPPWISPSPYWTMAFALLAFLRPHIRLANPESMSALFPNFWLLYNKLPQVDTKTLMESYTHAQPNQNTKPAAPRRRRFIAEGVYTDLPEPPPPADLD